MIYHVPTAMRLDLDDPPSGIQTRDPWTQGLVHIYLRQSAPQNWLQKMILICSFDHAMNLAQFLRFIINRGTSWENLFMPYANNNGADQPAHLCSLISAFVVCCLDSSLASLFSSEQTETPRTEFLLTWLNYKLSLSWNFP